MPSRWRSARASLRDTWLLLREFGWPLFFFGAAVVGGGSIYYTLAEWAGEAVSDLPEAIYLVLTMTFLQAVGEFPRAWYLEAFYFVMPLVGLIIIAQGVADFGVLLFNRRARGKEWEMAVASTFNQHIVLIGLGHLGYRVVRHLHEMNQDVVAVELSPTADLVAAVKQLGVPVLQDDATRLATLEAAGVRKARAVLLCTQNDSMNLQIALKARKLNPSINVVVRIFDDDFADALHEQFGFTAFSATGMAAPAFASAAAGVDMTRPITIEGETLSLAYLSIGKDSSLSRYTIGELEKRFNLSVVLLRRDHESDLHPPGDELLMAGDALGVLGGPKEIQRLSRENRRG
jgi:Trk K+ transport system NAD-binding subunit